MLRSLHTAATGMIAQQTNIDVIANNMANVETTGYRRLHAEFRDLVYTAARTPGSRTAAGAVVPNGVMIGHGARLSATEFSLVEGALEPTDSPLDLAIEGAGYFQIRRPDGELVYTRNGNFRLDPEGRLVTTEGMQVEPAITLPQGVTAINIGADGVVTVTLPGSGETQEVGRLELATFPNAGGLQALGRNLYRATTATGPALIAQPGAEGLGTLAQGMLEGSNVEVVNEMVDLIASQRAYELNHRVIQAADDMLRKATEVSTVRPRPRGGLARAAALALALGLGASASHASAQDGRIRLSEVLPALEGTELGALDLGPAPPPGTVRTVRRGDVLAALRGAGRSAEGLAIPRETRVERRAVVLSREALAAQAREAIAAAVAPCAVGALTIATDATVGEGPLTIAATGPARPDDGAAVVMLALRSGGVEARLPARVELTCPAAVVRAGSDVSVVVNVGGVRVSGRGTARQEGRIGDVVRVRVDTTGALVEARVTGPGVVEVRP